MRILRKGAKGEPGVGNFTTPWGRPGLNGKRRRLSLKTFRKQTVEEKAGMGGVETTQANAARTIVVPAGTVVPQARGKTILKKTNLTPKPAKGTKVIKPPSPTNRGGVKNPYKQ